jgi:hypothetical protein
VPDIIRYYLSEEPILLNVDTYRMEEPDHLEYALEHLAELVIKPVDGSGGKGIVIGSQADSSTLSKAREAILDNPRGWIAQREIALSTVPTLIGDKMRPRHVDLRPFAVNDGNSVWVLPGGLTRVALPEGELVVNSSQGGGSKDTWVLAAADEPVAPIRDQAQAPGQAHGIILDDLPIPEEFPAQSQSQSQFSSWEESPAQSTGAFFFDPPVTPLEDGDGLRHQQGQQQQEQRC